MKRLLLSAAVLLMTSPTFAKDVDTSGCNAVLEITHYYATSAVAYKFDGEDAEKIIAEVIDRIGPMPTQKDPPAIVWVGLRPDTQSADIFFYDAKGCFVNYTPHWRMEHVLELLDEVGVSPPFGTTFFQIPGSPGGRAGTSI